jgi:uncharacterized protein (TIGR01777 family)
MVGRALTASLLRDEHEVVILTRSHTKARNMELAGAQVAEWDGKSARGWGVHAEGASAIVNLAGANLSAGRWTPERKREILESRVNAGRAVVEAVEQAADKPKVVVQASGANYYGVKDQGVMGESCPPGDDFLADVCVQWEQATAPVESLGVRQVITRSAAVLDKNEGALPRMALPFKFFVGGPLGSGKQWFPWVHLTDVVGVIRFLIEKDTAVGVYNLGSPQITTNRQFSKTLGKVLSRPSFIPVPSFVIRLMFGEMSTVVLEGNQLVPGRLAEAGYPFVFPQLEEALRDIFKK